MYDELMTKEMAQNESVAVDSHEDTKEQGLLDNSEVTSNQCENGVCLVVWKPQRIAAA